MRMGTDLVHVCAPERAADAISSFSPDLIADPIRTDYLNNWHTKLLLEEAENFDAVVIGGGLDNRPDTMMFIQNFLNQLEKPCVVDADAIAAVSKNKEVIKKSFILTPHSREFFLLSGSEPSIELKKREEETRKLARDLNTTILLKGSVDIVSNGKETLLNKTGNPWMTKGGTGDILAGVCGGFLSMGNPPFDSACAAAHLTGLAGDQAEREVGVGLIASDMIMAIPHVLKRVLK
jgi:NAD(P)H-hydrate epimerase